MSEFDPSKRPPGFFTPITDFAWQQEDYRKSAKIEIFIDLKGVGTHKKCDCKFTASSVDFIALDFNGKNYRLLVDPLYYDIEVEKCKIVLKRDRVVLKLYHLKTDDSSNYPRWYALQAPINARAERAAEMEANLKRYQESLLKLEEEKKARLEAEMNALSIGDPSLDIAVSDNYPAYRSHQTEDKRQVEELIQSLNTDRTINADRHEDITNLSTSKETVKSPPIFNCPKIDNAPPPVLPHDQVAYVPIDGFGWDFQPYNVPHLVLYVELEGVGTAKDRCTLTCTARSFDLIVLDLNGKNYRLLKDKLYKDIDPAGCKIVVKPHKIVVKLKKVVEIVNKEESYPHWSRIN